MSLTPVNPAAEARKKRIRHKRARQSMVALILVGGVALALVLAIAVYTGKIQSPITRDFITSEPETDPPVAEPCPLSDKSVYLAAGDVKVTVLNATDTAGLATEVSNQLGERGFRMGDPGNDATGTIVGAAIIRTGYAGLDAAYTLATQIEGARIAYTGRAGDRVNLVLGEGYESLIDAADATIPVGEKIEKRAGCTQVKPPTKSASPTKSATAADK